MRVPADRGSGSHDKMIKRIAGYGFGDAGYECAMCVGSGAEIDKNGNDVGPLTPAICIYAQTQLRGNIVIRERWAKVDSRSDTVRVGHSDRIARLVSPVEGPYSRAERRHRVLLRIFRKRSVHQIDLMAKGRGGEART